MRGNEHGKGNEYTCENTKTEVENQKTYTISEKEAAS